MPIVFSEIVSQTPQEDGRIRITERHRDHVGMDYPRSYPAPIGSDTNAILIARAARLTEELKQDDMAACVFTAPWDYVLTHATNSDLVVYVRLLYRSASRETLAKIAKRILEWIDNGRFTDAQVRNGFNLTANQWTTLKTKMQTLVNSYAVVDSAEGE